MLCCVFVMWGCMVLSEVSSCVKCISCCVMLVGVGFCSCLGWCLMFR